MDPHTHTTLRPAGLLRRLAAACYDGFLLFGVLFAAAAIYGAIANLIQAHDIPHYKTGDTAHALEPVAQGWVYRLYLLAVITLFYASFWCKTGQTLGMQAWRILLQTEQGHTVSFPRAIWRVIIAIATLGPLAMLTIPLTQRRQALFDIICKTQVVHLPKATQTAP